MSKNIAHQYFYLRKQICKCVLKNKSRILYLLLSMNDDIFYLDVVW